MNQPAYFMKAKKIIAIVLVTALFPWLFYENQIGLNLLIFNLLIFAGLFFTNKFTLNNSLNRVVLVGSLLSAFFVVFNGSDLAITINILSLFLLGGTLLFPKVRNPFYSSLISLINFFSSQLAFLHLLQDMLSGIKGTQKVLRFLKIVIIPIVIVFVFILIYKLANPVFEGIVKSFFDALNDFFTWIFENIEIALFMTFVFGLVLSNYFFLGEANITIVKLDSSSSNQLSRKSNSNKTGFSMVGLKNEYSSAIILFTLLNILILVINVIDIWWVWFNFEWEGDYLKQFVHEGTYLLILSIVISLAISIYYFRGNINFLRNNAILKKLAYVWLAQNAILTISVGIRNFWYINYFSLAYLRIGVIFFLLLTLYSIYIVVVKIRDQKSTYYLFSKNSIAAYILLVIMAFFNWDVIIAKYNFSHSETAFVHFDFLAELSNSALPYLDKSKEELSEIDDWQLEKFPFRKQYMNSDIYYDQIQLKKKHLLDSWPNDAWQEWNYSGHRSYQKLIRQQE